MTTLERRQRITDTVGELFLLEVNHPSFAGPLRIANDTNDWVHQGDTYLGVNFGFKWPDDVADSPPILELQLSNVGRGISEDLESLLPGDILMARLKLVDRSTPDVVERDLPLPIYHVTLTNEHATARAGVDHIMRQQAVKIRFDPRTTPGLFGV